MSVLERKARVHIDPKIPGKIQIFIRTLTGASFSILSNNEETVYDVKLRIEETQGIPPYQCRLTFCGKQLDDDVRLKDYNVQKESTLFMITRLRGGMYVESSGRNGFEQVYPVTIHFMEKLEPLKTTVPR